MSMEKYLNKITCGDSYKLIKELPDKSVDCIYTDIPYLYTAGYHKHENKCGVGISKQLVEDLSGIINGIDYTILDEFIRVMKIPNIFIWCSKEQIQYLLNYFIDKKCYYDILVWCKTNPQPLARNSFLSDLEYCLYFRGGGVVLNDRYELKSKYYVSSLNQKDKDLFNHPTIKPLPLVKRHILHATQPNDIVLDCFMGSGTTAVACQETNRQYIGFEIEPKWVKVANDRLNKVDQNGQTCMFLR